MNSKSTISTAQAETLLKKGWTLKEFKDTSRKMHDFYVHDSRPGYCGRAHYINRTIFLTLSRRWPVTVHKVD